MNTLFDAAGLAIVAYLEVTGSDGSSNNCNSGVTTTKLGTGHYDIILPANKLQSSPRDLIFIEVNGTLSATAPFTSVVDNSDPQTKHVGIYGASPIVSYADSDFTVLILRTIVTPPAGSPA